MEPLVCQQVFLLLNGPSDFTNGTLSISSTGTYDANGTFTAASGNVTFTGAGFLNVTIQFLI